MRQLALLAVLLTSPAFAFGQFQPGLPGLGGGAAKSFNDVASLKVEVTPEKALPGEVVTLKFTVTPKPNCTTYPFFADQTSRNNVNPNPANPLVLIGPLENPPGVAQKKNAEGLLEDVYKQATTWELKAVVSPKAGAASGPVELKGFTFQACNPTNCFNNSKVSVPLEILSGDPKPVPAEYQPWVDAHLKGEPKPLDWTPPPQNTGVKPPADDDGDWWMTLLVAAGWGLVSLITPCVFPMIPITVSLFLKQSHGSTAGAVKQAAVYCLTIIVVLGVPTVFLLGSFTKLSVDPFMNVFLAGLFVFFALSLFGAYEATIRATFWFVSLVGGAVVLTSAVVTHLGVSRGDLTAEKEFWGLVGRWVAFAACVVIAGVLFATRRPGSQDGLVKFADAQRKAGGVLGTVFGAVLFSVISFTCVAPFLGAFAGLVATPKYANGNEWKLIPVGLAFSTAFASPFFVLALFPSLIKKLPKSGGWLDVVKAVMGFIELAAAFKFARTAELRWLDPTKYFTYSVCLTAFAVISGVCGLYLLGVFRLPHDEDERGKLSVPRLLFALAFVGLGVYLVPGLFQRANGENQRPTGEVFAWVDSFLLPEPSPVLAVTAGGAAQPTAVELPARDLKVEVARIAGELKKWEEEKKTNSDAKPPKKRLIFIDFTGVTCSNCRLNERDVFPRPEVASLLKQYTEVQLYTDTVPVSLYAGSPTPPLAERDAEAQENKNTQQQLGGTLQLPLYVILEVKSDGSTRVVDVYPEGKINNVPAFVEFLRKPLEERE